MIKVTTVTFRHKDVAQFNLSELVLPLGNVVSWYRVEAAAGGSYTILSRGVIYHGKTRFKGD